MAALFRSLLFIAITASSAEAQTAPEAVRVRLFADADPTAVTVRAAEGALQVESVPTDGPVRLGIRGRAVEASTNGRTDRTPSVRLSADLLSVRLGATERTYRGDLTVRVASGRLEIVNAVPVEDYVASVVASEYPFPESAGIEAQAVLARTYALRRAGAARTYDLDDHQGSQVYRGASAVTDRSRRAALATAGEVLTYRGDLAETPYFSSSGGHTADNEAVWRGAPLPYLRGVPDPTDAESPYHRWTASVPQRLVHDALARSAGGRVTTVEIAERSRNGRVKSFRLGGNRSVSGGAFRTAVNAAQGAETIRSTHFDIRRDGDRYVFEGRGFGHGVGMSQYGARGLAQQGRTYREILNHYFRGTSLDRLGVGAPYASDRPREPDRAVPARTRTWPVPRRVAREAAAAPRRRAW